MMSEIHSMYSLSRSEKKRLLEKIKESIPVPANLPLDKLNVTILKTRRGFNLYRVEDVILLWEIDDEIYPTILALLLYRIDIPGVIVDRGAVPHILNGADVMRPGIVFFKGDFEKGDLVAIYEEEKRRAIALGRALFSRNEIESMRRGKVVKNLHHIKDKIWDLCLKYSKLQT